MQLPQIDHMYVQNSCWGKSLENKPAPADNLNRLDRMYRQTVQTAYTDCTERVYRQTVQTAYTDCTDKVYRLPIQTVQTKCTDCLYRLYRESVQTDCTDCLYRLYRQTETVYRQTVVPPTRRSSIGDGAFPVAASRVWNSLPLTVSHCSCSSDSSRVDCAVCPLLWLLI